MYQIPELLKFPKLFHAFSTVPDGNMANSILGRLQNFEQVVKNREKFLSGLGIPVDSCICVWVQHKDQVKAADRKLAGKSMRDFNFAAKVDGLITNEKNLYLFLLIADCLPIIAYDPKKQVVGIVHAGWTGVDLNIVGKVVKTLRKEFRSEPRDLIVGIGPCARKESYIKENPSQRSDPKWQPFIEKFEGDSIATLQNLYKVDFVGLCKKQMLDAGISEKNIFDCEIDTVKDKRFFSHYRDKNLPIEEQGRFACVVGVK